MVVWRIKIMKVAAIAMNLDSLRKMFGDEYPEAAVVDGVRIPLSVETQFYRYYNSGDPRVMSQYVSRFMDGSASMTLEQLRREWPMWTKLQRSEFCRSSIWLFKQIDYPDMLRFIIQDGGPDEWSAAANRIAANLPAEEAFRFLVGAFGAIEVGERSNIIQAMAITKQPDAQAILRKHLETVWQHPDLWKKNDSWNQIAFEATTCIENLIALGASPADFEDKVRKLSQHTCAKNRDNCRNFLSKHYSWLN